MCNAWLGCTVLKQGLGVAGGFSGEDSHKGGGQTSTAPHNVIPGLTPPLHVGQQVVQPLLGQAVQLWRGLQQHPAKRDKSVVYLTQATVTSQEMAAHHRYGVVTQVWQNTTDVAEHHRHGTTPQTWQNSRSQKQGAWGRWGGGGGGGVGGGASTETQDHTAQAD